MKTRTELMRNINDMMTFAGHSLTEDQDAVLCAALQTLIPDYFQPCPEINRQLLNALKGLFEDVTGLINESYRVAGFHHNDDVAGWGELEAGGRFERLTHLPIAQDAIAAAEKEICK